MVTVCTFVPPAERSRLEAAGSGCFAAVHADSARELFAAARRYRVDALVISVHRCRSDELPAVARFVREFPAIPAVALVSRPDSDAPQTLLRLGATGVRTAVDCTDAGGWGACGTLWLTRLHRSRPASLRTSSRSWRTSRKTHGCSSRPWPASRRCCAPSAASPATCARAPAP